jgi:hypothetical protein
VRKELLVKGANGTDGGESSVKEEACRLKDRYTVMKREELERIRLDSGN